MLNNNHMKSTLTFSNGIYYYSSKQSVNSKFIQIALYLKFILIVAAISIASVSITSGQAPCFNWAKSSGGVLGDGASNVCVDDWGNIYYTGNFESGVFVADTFNLTNVGNTDIFLVKSNSNGDVIWAKSFGGSSFEKPETIKTDSEGNIYLAGYFHGSSISFDSISIINGYANAYNLFIAKIDQNGSVVWVETSTITVPSAYNDNYAKDMQIDNSGNIIVIGSFMSNVIMFDSLSVNHAGGYSNVFIVKYDKDGNTIWARRLGNSPANTNSFASSLAYSLAIDSHNSIYLAGHLGGSLIINNVLISASEADAFIAKLDSNGIELWGKSFSGISGHDYAHAIIVDINGHIYVGGYFVSHTLQIDSILLVNPNNDFSNMFVAKFDSLGNVIWAKKASGGNGLGGNYNMSLAIDDSLNIYLPINFNSDILYFDSLSIPNSNITYLDGDFCLFKLNPTGDLLYFKKIGGGANEYVTDLAIDLNNNCYLIGYFGGYNTVSSQFDAYMLNSNNPNTTDCYIAKIDQITYGAPEVCNGQDDDCNGIIDDNISAVEICGNGLDENCNGQIDENCCAITTTLGNDISQLFGFIPEQCNNINAQIYGGTPPYVYNWYLNRPLLTDIINSSGDEIFVVNPNNSLTICLIDSAEVCISVTDANGCNAFDCMTVRSEDVRCFSGNSNIHKILICHNNNSICIDENAIQSHLNHGDIIGRCNSSRENIQKANSYSRIYPNPADDFFTLKVRDNHSTPIEAITLLDISGRIIKEIIITDSHEYLIRTTELNGGVYFVEVKIQNASSEFLKITILK